MLKLKVLSKAWQIFAEHGLSYVQPFLVLMQPQFLKISLIFPSKNFFQYKFRRIKWCDKDRSLRLSRLHLNRFKSKSFRLLRRYTQILRVFWTWGALFPRKKKAGFKSFIARKILDWMTCRAELFKGSSSSPKKVFSLFRGCSKSLLYTFFACFIE